MANEATVNAGLQIKLGNGFYQSMPSSFRADVSAFIGPTPGAITVPTTGANVNLSALTSPGLCRIQNIDGTNYVRYGIHDGALFHPLGRILPGESYVLRLDHSLGEEESDTGTGTSGPVNSLYLKAVGASCVVLVEAFNE